MDSMQKEEEGEEEEEEEERRKEEKERKKRKEKEKEKGLCEPESPPFIGQWRTVASVGARLFS